MTIIYLLCVIFTESTDEISNKGKKNPLPDHDQQLPKRKRRKLVNFRKGDINNR